MNFNLIEADWWLDKSHLMFWLAFAYSLFWCFFVFSFHFSSHVGEKKSRWQTTGIATCMILMLPILFNLFLWSFVYITWSDLRNGDVNLGIMISDGWLQYVGLVAVFLLVFILRRKKRYNASIWKTLALNPAMAFLLNAFFPGSVYSFKGYSWVGFLLVFFLAIFLKINYLYSIVLHFIAIVIYYALPIKKN